MSATSVRSEKITALEEVVRLITLNQVAMANDVLSSTIPANESATLWQDALHKLANEQQDEALPKGIDIDLLLGLGLSAVDTANTNSQMIVDTLTRVTNINLDELLRHAADTDYNAPFEDDGMMSTWDIDHDLNAFFIDRFVHEEEPRIGTAGYMYLDWLPGVTTFDAKTGALRNFRVILKPHGPVPVSRNAEPHIFARRVGALVTGGTLRDVQILMMPDGTSGLNSEACWCEVP